MSRSFDAVVIGGGANGLVAATALGKSGLRVLLLEAAEALGGQSRLVEFAPGFRAAPLATDPGWLPPTVARATEIDSPVRLSVEAPVTIAAAGEHLTLWRDTARAADAIRPLSHADAKRWPSFIARLRKLAGFLETLYRVPPPDVDAPAGELLSFIGLARRFRGLGREDMLEFLRTLPMSVWELLDDFFESGLLKAAVAPGGMVGVRQGPRSGGTGFALLHGLVGAEAGVARGRAPWRDGPEAFTRAAHEAALRAGVTVRTGAQVARIEVRDESVAGVVISTGETISTSRVLSTADAARTFLGWVDPVWLDPEFLHAVRNIRYRDSTAWVLYALAGLPEIPGLTPEALRGVITLTPSLKALEQAADCAKYGSMSERPHVEVTVPSLHVPGLAPEGKHVLVARVQHAPYRLGNGTAWDAAGRETLERAVTDAIAAVIPGFVGRVLHRTLLVPPDIEARFGLTAGAASHGEVALDQILFMRPVAGWARYATPIAGLYLGGAGAHPGPGVLGGPGWLAAQRLLGNRPVRAGESS